MRGKRVEKVENGGRLKVDVSGHKAKKSRGLPFGQAERSLPYILRSASRAIASPLASVITTASIDEAHMQSLSDVSHPRYKVHRYHGISRN